MTSRTDLTPTLSRHQIGDVALHLDQGLLDQCGIVVAFSERSGGESDSPFSSLNLGLHVGDAPEAVAANRRTFLTAAGVPHGALAHVVSAHQVHGVEVLTVDDLEQVPAVPSPGTDALITPVAGVPLLLCFADCVPVILVAPGDHPVVAVVHSGWRGTLNDISGVALRKMVDDYGVDPASVLAYIGPYIGPNNFAVGQDVWTQFDAAFGTLTPVFTADGAVRFDLANAVRESLTTLGVQGCNIASMGVCTVDSVDRFFSYRAEGGVTGRLGALACIL